MRDALDPVDRPRGATKALAWIAAECEDVAPRRPLDALRDTRRGAAALTAWFRETVEVRDAEGSERILRTLVEEHRDAAARDAVFRACTDHRYGDGGHMLDFGVKCGELAARFPSDRALQALLYTSLVPPLTAMQRSEETSPWRMPVDVAGLVQACAADLPERFGDAPLDDEAAYAERLLEDDPEKVLGSITARARGGTSPVALAEAVIGAATRRVLRFGPANEIPDWETVHHTLTYANAVAEAMSVAPSRDLFRGVLDGAASVYLDRFLNVPPHPLPRAPGGAPDPREMLALFDRRGSVEDATALALGWLQDGGAPDRLLAVLAHAVLREDAGFHDHQAIDLAWRRLQRRGNDPEAQWTLVACARFLAARYPTRRAQEQTYTIALRLHRGETLHE